MLTQTLIDLCKPVKRHRNWSSIGRIFRKKITDIQKRRRIEVFFGEELVDNCKPVNRHKKNSQKLVCKVH